MLFPNVFLPLHIFEPRYRQMVADALAGDRIIGMVLLRPGHEDDYDGAPPIYTTGCSGLITHVEQLEDGRYNLVLRGLEKFAIQSEEHTGASGGSTEAPWSRRSTKRSRQAIASARDERKRLQKLLTPMFSDSLRSPAAREDAGRRSGQRAGAVPGLRAAGKARAARAPGPLARCRSMIELLEMKAMSQGSGDRGRADALIQRSLH